MDNENAKLKRKLKALKDENAELKETLRVIQSGEVDALVVNGPWGERIFTLQSAEQPYRELVEAMNEGALTVTPDGTILYCNAKFESMTKGQASRIIGSDFRAHIRPESRAAVEDLISKARHTPSAVEILLHVEPGEALPVQLSIAAIELVGAEGFCVIATDLSAQKKNAVTTQQREWLSKLLNSLPVPLVLLESNLAGVLLINAKAHEVLDHDPETPIEGSSPKELLSFENESGEVMTIESLVEKAQVHGDSFGLEVTLDRNRAKVPVLVYCETLPAMYGKEPAKLLMFQDISVMKQAQKELTFAIKGRDQFMAALSHELRTPLNVILGWVQLLRANPNDENMFIQALDTLERNAELQRVLIEDLLDMSRIITGNLVLEIKPLDLKSSVRDCLVSLRLKAEEKNIDLRADLVVEPAIISADDKRIQQLISNLVQNAIKFTPAGGRIVVSVRTSIFNQSATIRVSDTGQGIDSNFLPHVFDQFKQENMTTNRAYGGLGLGLAICKTIVEQHQGQINVSSEGKGKGATFTVKLPLSSTYNKPIPGRAFGIENVLNLDGIRVLVVDDSADNLYLFSVWLKKAGAEIKTLSSAAEIVEVIESFRPHVLLSDISMPGEDGFALISKVRALPENRGGTTPAGAITANARAEDRSQTLAAGFQLHIPKPVTNGALVEAVKSLLNFSRNESH